MLWHTHIRLPRNAMRAGLFLVVLLLVHQSGCSEISETISEAVETSEVSETAVENESTDLTGSDAVIILPCPYAGHYHQIVLPAVGCTSGCNNAPITPAYTTPRYEETTYTTTTEYYEPPTTTTTYRPPTTTTEIYYPPPTTKYWTPRPYTTRRPYYERPKPTMTSYRYEAPAPRVVKPSFTERPAKNYNYFKTFKPVKEHNTYSYFSQRFPPSHMMTTYTHTHYYTETPSYYSRNYYSAAPYTHTYTHYSPPPKRPDYDIYLREPLPTTTEYYVEPVTKAPCDKDEVYVAPTEPTIVIEPTPVVEYEAPTPCCGNLVSEPIIIVQEPELPCDKDPIPVYTTTPKPVYETEPPAIVTYKPELPCDKDTKTEYVAPSYSDVTPAPTYSSYEPPLTTYSQQSVDKVETPAERPVIGYTASYGFPGPYLSMAYGYPNLPCNTCQQTGHQSGQPFLVLLPMWYQGFPPVTPNNVIPQTAYAPSYSYDSAVPSVYSTGSSYDNNKSAYGKYPESTQITITPSSKEAEETLTYTVDHNMATQPPGSSQALNADSLQEAPSHIITETLFYPKIKIASTVPAGHTPFLPSPFLLESLLS